jgi:hypothetical protein
VRGILGRIIDALESDDKITDGLGLELIAYGRALDVDARWKLAADVFATVASLLPERAYPRVVIEASTAMGAAARNAGDWAASDKAYARAEHLAERNAEYALSLTAQVGIATNELVRGNLPAAEHQLIGVVSEAHERGLQDVEAIALHASATVAHYKGDFERAINLAYHSLELTTRGGARDRLLSDIAAAYGSLGMRKAAIDGHTIVLLTAAHQWVRWQAELNLMELAIEEGDEEMYANHLRHLSSAELDVKLRSYFLYFKALGAQRFDPGSAARLFAEAQAYAEANRLNQLAFEIESARNKPQPQAGPSAEPSGELLRIAEALGHLRHEASV